MARNMSLEVLEMMKSNFDQNHRVEKNEANESGRLF